MATKPADSVTDVSARHVRCGAVGEQDDRARCAEASERALKKQAHQAQEQHVHPDRGEHHGGISDSVDVQSLRAHKENGLLPSLLRDTKAVPPMTESSTNA